MPLGLVKMLHLKVTSGGLGQWFWLRKFPLHYTGFIKITDFFAKHKSDKMLIFSHETSCDLLNIVRPFKFRSNCLSCSNT